MGYDNTSYWKDMHKKYGDSLKSVGISSLCEEYNSLKYSSEGESFTEILDNHVTPTLRSNEISVLDIGAGIGVWSHLVNDYYHQKKIVPSITAVDISNDALHTIKEKNSLITTEQIDLKTVDIDHFIGKFDCVIAVCCFHHIVDLQGYKNALQFAARSLKPNGILIIEDPILSKPYSRFYQTDFSIFSGHSFPRPSYLIDDIVMNEGLRRQQIMNGLSFLLGGNMESYSKLGFTIQRKIWNSGYFILYRSNMIVKIITPLIRWLDTFFKKTKYSNGTIFMIYKKC